MKSSYEIALTRGEDLCKFLNGDEVGVYVITGLEVELTDGSYL
jgi:hypothetical protein